VIAEVRTRERNLIDGMEPTMEEVTFTYSLYREEYVYEDDRLTSLRVYKSSGASTDVYEHGELSNEYTFEYDDGNMTQLVLSERPDTPRPVECDGHGNVISIAGTYRYTYEKITLPREDAMELIGKAGVRGDGVQKFNPLDLRIQYRIEQ